MLNRWHVFICAGCGILFVGIICVVISPAKNWNSSLDGLNEVGVQQVNETIRANSTTGPPPPSASKLLALPQQLVDRNVYSNSDFPNEKGIMPTYWHQTQSCAGGECTPLWGPCFPAKEPVDWDKEIAKHSSGVSLQYNPRKIYYRKDKSDKPSVDNCCRPGFLIIGQGKCGTSSLYHYLVGHPRVVPASEKQIHYFKVSGLHRSVAGLPLLCASCIISCVFLWVCAQYYATYPMRWYLSHFPSATSYLSSGALMTGEASPGYLPYPDVVALVASEMRGTKIICVGRDPLDRSYSSYRYNYVNPAIEKLKKGGSRGIAARQPDEYYHQFLFSFEEMMRAELKTLKECLKPGGIGERGAMRVWGSTSWGRTVYGERTKDGLSPLIDLDGQCYGKYYSAKAPRKQWAELAEAQPDKFLSVPNLHLSQAMIGRSLYTYPLEWWYSMFPKEDIYFVCTEEMRDLSGEPLNRVGEFLGLPTFNFSSVVGQGMYNVGGHKGYDKVTSWEQVHTEHDGQNATQNNNDKEPIPISPEFRKEMLDFFRPHNERLFKLIGRRCNWET